MGSPASCMSLELFSADDKFLQKMDDNDALLGSYHVDNYCRIHVSSWSLLSTFNMLARSLLYLGPEIFLWKCGIMDDG